MSYTRTLIGLAINVRVYIMDFMLEGNKNLKDPERKPLASYGAGTQNMSVIGYSKTNKLITALYIVTDIMDKEEPIRLKLRTLGVEILSDTFAVSSMSKMPFGINKIDQVLSFLDIASTIGMTSEMNCSILKKEFNELKQSIQESRQGLTLSLSEFFTEDFILNKEERNKKNPIGHIGVQKGSTLMKALSHLGGQADRIPNLSNNKLTHVGENSFDILKKQRRESILKIIKAYPSSGGNSSNGMSIKDIVLTLRSPAYQSVGRLGEEKGEKTLQRELVSMVKDGVLKKSGEKRWSRYFLPK